MRVKSRLLIITVCAMTMLLNAASMLAQEPRQERERAVEQNKISAERIAITVGQEGPVALAFGGQREANTFVYLSQEMSVNGKLVKGAPYSAQAITESIQTLSDGNRIVRKSTAQIYRDSEGRTRREQTFNAIGPWAPAGDAPQVIFISDAVAGVNYVLEPRERTARKMPNVQVVSDEPGNNTFVIAPSAPAARERAMADRRKVEAELSNVLTVRKPLDSDNAKTESLGKQVIEGVEAEGTRFTITIPAGEIGNELPIHIVSERWYSPELQVVVMSKHSDPRFGENIYRLTGISRNEPARSLFEVPSDYTIKEGPALAPKVLRRSRNSEDDKLE